MILTRLTESISYNGNPLLHGVYNSYIAPIIGKLLYGLKRLIVVHETTLVRGNYLYKE